MQVSVLGREKKGRGGVGGGCGEDLDEGKKMRERESFVGYKGNYFLKQLFRFMFYLYRG